MQPSKSFSSYLKNSDGGEIFNIFVTGYYTEQGSDAIQIKESKIFGDSVRLNFMTHKSELQAAREAFETELFKINHKTKGLLDNPLPGHSPRNSDGILFGFLNKNFGWTHDDYVATVPNSTLEELMEGLEVNGKPAHEVYITELNEAIDDLFSSLAPTEYGGGTMEINLKGGLPLFIGDDGFPTVNPDNGDAYIVSPQQLANLKHKIIGVKLKGKIDGGFYTTFQLTPKSAVNLDLSGQLSQEQIDGMIENNKANRQFYDAQKEAKAFAENKVDTSAWGKAPTASAPVKDDDVPF